MKERPILFSGPMVRAILDGSKTQTRRLVSGEALSWLVNDKFSPAFVADYGNRLCKHGHPGDRLWVRETWAPMTNGYAYGADPVWNASPDGKWRPSIHMPRDACRLVLDITSVSVERLQDISEADARSEGISYDPGDGGTFHVADLAGCCSDSAADSFRKLWESINGPESWAANPWVWAIEFRSGE